MTPVTVVLVLMDDGSFGLDMNIQERENKLVHLMYIYFLHCTATEHAYIIYAAMRHAKEQQPCCH